jgi:hypothetical protein
MLGFELRGKTVGILCTGTHWQRGNANFKVLAAAWLPTIPRKASAWVSSMCPWKQSMPTATSFPALPVQSVKRIIRSTDAAIVRMTPGVMLINKDMVHSQPLIYN